MRRTLLALAVAFTPVMALAADVEVRLQSGALSFSGGAGFTNAVLTVRGPDDFEAEETARRGLPVFRVRGGRMKDGFYHYTLLAATDERVKLRGTVDNGRGDGGRDFLLKPFSMSGIFEIYRGTIRPVEAGASGDGDG